MSLITDIVRQLQDFGLDISSFSDIGGITPTDISERLQSFYDIEAEDLPAHLFQGISPDLVKSGIGKTYSPQIEASGSNLLSDLYKTYSSPQATQAYGGFAGSGQQQQFAESAKDVYGKGMSNVIFETAKQRMGGLQNIQDIINQWRETSLDISGQGGTSFT